MSLNDFVILVAQWLLCLDYSLVQGRHDAHYFTREKETINRLKQLKMIPLKHEAHLVSMDEYEKQGIMLPSAKSAQLSKHLKLVLDDLPTLDEQLLNFVEDKQARQLDSIKSLLKKLGKTFSMTLLQHRFLPYRYQRNTSNSRYLSATYANHHVESNTLVFKVRIHSHGLSSVYFRIHVSAKS